MRSRGRCQGVAELGHRGARGVGGESAPPVAVIRLVQAVGELCDDRRRQPGRQRKRGTRQLRRIRPRPAPIAALTTAANTRQSVRSLLRARRPFAVSSYARRRRSGPIRGGDPHGRPCCEVIPLRRRRESARMLGSEREWVRRPEVAQHRHVMLVLDVDCHLMDLERNFQSATFCSARRRRARASAWSAH